MNAWSALRISYHPVFKIALVVFVLVFGILWYRVEMGQGITGVEVLERETSPGGVHEYVAYRTYGPGEEFWYLAVVPTEHPIFMERQYHVMRFDQPPRVTLEWASDTELVVTLPVGMDLAEDVPKRTISGDVTIRYANPE